MTPCNGWLFLSFDELSKCLEKGTILILGKKENLSQY